MDAVLVLAQAVNDTLAGWSNNSPDWSFCEGEESEKNASVTKCFYKQKLLGISLQGLTVIVFSSHTHTHTHNTTQRHTHTHRELINFIKLNAVFQFILYSLPFYKL